MIIGRVVGNVVSTVKHTKLEAAKLLIVQPLDLDGREKGEALIAVDSVDAGVGDTVLLVLEGRAASKAIEKELAPVESACVGVIDYIDLY